MKRLLTNKPLIQSLEQDSNNTTSLFMTFMNKLNSPTTQQYIRQASNILDKAAPFFTKPNVFTFLTGIMGVASVLNEENIVYTDCYFENDRFWERVKLAALNDFLVEALQNEPFELISPFDDKKNVIKIVNTHGIKIGWAINSQKHIYDDSMYYEHDQFEVVVKILREFLYNKFQNKSIVLRQKTTGPNSKVKLEFVEDTLIDALQSEKATNLAKNIQAAFNVNENRSLLLFGPPGSGKSTIARQITKELNLNSLRIRVEDLDNDSSILFEIIEVFKPDVIIFDDFDRDNHTQIMLESIAFIRQNVKLLIATANRKGAIDDAILRPGRFDEIHLVNSIDENVILNILGEHKHMLKDVRTWPIAFIQELVRRLKWLSEAEAKQSLIELAERVKKLDKYSNDDCGLDNLLLHPKTSTQKHKAQKAQIINEKQ